jgi:uncharacterized protein (TIGR03083 family)
VKPLEPRDTTPLFIPLLAELTALLRSLEPEMWNRATVAPRWRVRNVVAHLLDGDLRKLAICRDGHQIAPDGEIASDRDLLRFINQLNAGGVEFGSRLSEQLLVELVEITGRWVADYFAALPPHAPAKFGVSWAGEAVSENWMDIGREYTERWHHQMQIRDAVGRPRLLDPIWMEPLIEFAIRALPKAYATVTAADGTTITLDVRGETAGSWTLLRERNRWQLRRGRPSAPTTSITVATDDVWRLFFNALPAEATVEQVGVEGERWLAAPLLAARSVIV